VIGDDAAILYELRGVARGLDCLAEHLFGVLSRLEPSEGCGSGGGREDGVMSPLSPLLLTFHETALRLGVSVSTVERLVRDGRLPVVQIGRARRVLPEELEAYVAGLAAARGEIK